jgi:hypothetical protein
MCQADLKMKLHSTVRVVFFFGGSPKQPRLTGVVKKQKLEEVGYPAFLGNKILKQNC